MLDSDRAAIENRFTFHPVRDDAQADMYEAIRADAKALAFDLVGVCPSSRELSLAITHLEEVVFWANAAIARHDKKGERIGND